MGNRPKTNEQEKEAVNEFAVVIIIVVVVGDMW